MSQTNTPARPGFAEDTRAFCGWVLIGLLTLALMGAVPVYEELNIPGFGSCIGKTDILTALWLMCAFPLGAVCILIHYGVPGPGRGRGRLTHILAAQFGLVTLCWLGLRVWWYDEMLGMKSAAFDCLWWLEPLRWFWT